MKIPRILLSILSVIVYAFVVPGRVNAQWTVVTPAPTTNNLNSITYGNGQYVAVGNNSTVLTSPDGISWTQRALDTPIVLDLASIACGNGRFVAVSSIFHYHWSNLVNQFFCEQRCRSFTSTDGISWSRGTYDSYGSVGMGGYLCAYHVPGSSNRVVFGNGEFIAATNRTTYSYPNFKTSGSTDGISWTTRCDFNDQSLDYSISQLSFGNSTYILTLSSGKIRVSSNASAWTLRTSGTTNGLTSSAYGGWQYVTVGAGGIVLTSPDDSIWTIRPSGTCNNLSCVTYGNGQYVTVGSSGIILNSPDGISWAFDLSGTVNNLNSVATNGSGQFVAVGNAGTIVVNSGIPTATYGVKNPALLSTVLKIQTRNSFLSISLPSAMLGKAVDVAVYNSMGRKIMGSNVRSASGRFSLPTPNLALGTYILVVNDGSHKVSVKFVAMR